MSQGCSRMLAHFSGTVQGVGFRYTTVRIASEYEGLTGYVKNLPDGRVELLAEGPEGQVRDFLEELRAKMSGYIREAKLNSVAEPGSEARHYPSFEVEY